MQNLRIFASESNTQRKQWYLLELQKGKGSFSISNTIDPTALSAPTREDSLLLLRFSETRSSLE